MIVSVRRFVQCSVILCAACLAVLFASAGSQASGGSPVRAASKPKRFALAAQHGIEALLGQGGKSAVAWDAKTGLWGAHTPPNWWQSALAVMALVRYAERTGSHSAQIQHVLLRTFDLNRSKPHSAARRDFADEFMDDTAWWGIAWLDASEYELEVRHDPGAAGRFLAAAEYDARYIDAHPRRCGGIEWQIGTPPDTITNAEFVALTAGLANYRAGSGIFHNAGLAGVWRSEAAGDLRWLERSKLIDVADGTVLDSLSANCHARLGGTMTYTEGEVAEALVALGRALHQPALDGEAVRFLRYTVSPVSGLTWHGILEEHCEAVPAGCSTLPNAMDMPAYKGVFVDAVSDWEAATRSDIFRAFLVDQADAILARAVRGPGNTPGNCSSAAECRFAFHWTPSVAAGVVDRGTVPTGVGSQESALDALTVVLPVHS